MRDVVPFAALIAGVAAAGLLAVLSSRLTAWLRIPPPALFLVAAALASDLWPRLGGLSTTTVQRIVTVALVMILFDGGMHVGRRRLKTALHPILWLGVVGTLATAGALAMAAHWLFGLGWTTSLLIGTALAPTDPATVFSVLGRREIVGRSGVILEGESGANDPVGIALMAAILAGTAGGGNPWTTGVIEFLAQMAIGATVGVAGGYALAWGIRRLPLPSAALYPLRVLIGAFVLYGVATVVHGSGFLAVFIAGIMLGDVRAPYKGDIERISASAASLAEIIAFAVLGLSVSLKSLPDGNAWQLGIALAALLMLLVRPLFIGLLLLAADLRAGERVFIMWSGLKGAVPILLGTFVLAAAETDQVRIYDIIFVVVTISVLVQGGLIPLVARRCGVPMRTTAPEPFSLGVRLQHEPDNVHRYRVQAGSLAEGQSIRELALPDTLWISLISRDGRLVPITEETTFQAGDDVVAIGDPADETICVEAFQVR
jgi:cell volume regulation protein A